MISFAKLGPKLSAEKAELDAAKKKAERKAKREAKKLLSSSKPIKKKSPKVRGQTEWIGDPLDDPLPF